MKRLLTIGHSYVVAANRRLAHEMAVQGRGQWQVTAVAPQRLQGDLRTIDVEAIEGEACQLETLRMRLAARPHLRSYERRLNTLLNASSSPAGSGWDVIHVWEEPFVAACAQVFRHAPAGARVVPATFQNLAKRYPPPLSFFERTVMHRADAWVAFGETVHETQQTKPLYAAKPSRVISPGVDVSRFKACPARRTTTRAQLGLAAETPVVGYLGRFVPEKGLSTLMRALSGATQPWNALFVGGGPMLSDLEAFASRHPSRVRLLTGISHDEVPAYLDAMDLLCAPSETTSQWREQFGRMLIEAMACGVPVVASRSGEIPFVVGDAGVLVEEKDDGGWTAAIDRLLGDAALRCDLAARGLDRVHERFALPIVARAHLAFFDDLL